MKVTDGLFHQIFDEIKTEYPEIEANQQIIDIGTARVATAPERYDVIVTPNLYGDIISDVVAEVSGSVGMAGSANIGTEVSMFEAIHGSAPDIAGTNRANPSGLLNGALQMLVHIGRPAVAERIHNAWLSTLEAGIHTADIYRPGHSTHLAGTDEFADGIIERLGEVPKRLRPWSIDTSKDTRISVPGYDRQKSTKELVGVDVFVDWVGEPMRADTIGTQMETLAKQAGGALKLKMITNRGVKVYPGGFPETFLTDHWRCRFVGSDAADTGASYTAVQPKAVVDLLASALDLGIDTIKTENLYLFDGERGFSLGQGE